MQVGCRKNRLNLIASLLPVMLAILATGCSMHALIKPGEDSASVEITATRITDRAWYFRGESGMASQANRGFMSNAGFVVTGDGVVVFDALASPALGRAMLREIGRITDQPVKYVVVSHYHADHFYGLQAFKAQGAAILADQAGQAYLNSDAARERLAQRREALGPWVDANTRLVAADRWLRLSPEEPMTFELGGQTFRVMSAAHAHAPGDLMLYVPGQSLLFAGDVYATGRLPFVVDGNSRQWLDAIDRIASAAPEHVVPGHGRVSDNVERDVQLTRRYIEYLRKTMGAAADNLMTFEQAYAETDWSAFEKLPAFAEANRRNAYSVFLEMQEDSFGESTPDAP
ncbi:MAG: MBL fold metallo-hydrolase [Salinisphaeraceae bacterium]|nr:MBL fold metallo-hydrolase [Salinisphaeraceae bacterium]